jgi:hypothetical protein
MMRSVAAVAALVFAGSAAADRISIGTWNMEWMMTPATFDALASRCAGGDRRVGGGERAIPCNLMPASRWIHPNALTRVLGQVEPLVVDVSESEVETGDIVVLATDGLTNMLGTESIAQICTMDSDPASLADKLITAALRNGGRDNITVIVVSVRED